MEGSSTLLQGTRAEEEEVTGGQVEDLLFAVGGLDGAGEGLGRTT